MGKPSPREPDTWQDTVNTTRNLYAAGMVSGMPKQTVRWGALETGPTRPTVRVVRGQGQPPRNATVRGSAPSLHLGQRHGFLARGRSKWREYHHTPACPLEIWALNSSQTGRGKSFNQSWHHRRVFGRWATRGGRGGSSSSSPANCVLFGVWHGESARALHACQAAGSNFLWEFKHCQMIESAAKPSFWTKKLSVEVNYLWLSYKPRVFSALVVLTGRA